MEAPLPQMLQYLALRRLMICLELVRSLTRYFAWGSRSSSRLPRRLPIGGYDRGSARILCSSQLYCFTATGKGRRDTRFAYSVINLLNWDRIWFTFLSLAALSCFIFDHLLCPLCNMRVELKVRRHCRHIENLSGVRAKGDLMPLDNEAILNPA